MAIANDQIDEITSPLWKSARELGRIADAYPDLRDHFAGLAMQSLLADALRGRNWLAIKEDALWAQAYEAADAMLSAREGK